EAAAPFPSRAARRKPSSVPRGVSRPSASFGGSAAGAAAASFWAAALVCACAAGAQKTAAAQHNTMRRRFFNGRYRPRKHESTKATVLMGRRTTRGLRAQWVAVERIRDVRDRLLRPHAVPRIVERRRDDGDAEFAGRHRDDAATDPAL